MKERYYGIDLGTTNSALAYFSGVTAEIVSIDGAHTLPSVVEYLDDGKVNVGSLPYTRKGNPNVIYSTKRDIGTNKVYDLTLPSGKKIQVTPVEVAAEVLKYMVAMADPAYGKVEDAVITVPAYFTETQRRATIEAAELAGINVIKIINEPTAAALAYGVNKMEKDFESMLVVDIGGGTTDITYMEISNFDKVPPNLVGVLPEGLHFNVLATGGDTRLGGDDYDNYTVEAAKVRLCRENPREKKFIHQNIIPDNYRHIVEKWKQNPSITGLEVSIPKNNKTVNYSFTQDDLARGFERFWARIDATLQDTLSVKETTPDGEVRVVETYDMPPVVLPVGGSTKNPAILKMISGAYSKGGEIKIPDASFADEAIALGAAIQCALSKGALMGVSLKEVNPLPIGIAIIGTRNNKEVPGIFHPVIQKDVAVPTKGVVDVTTFQDNQQEVSLDIYQGTSGLCQGNQLLGVVKVTGLPARPAGGVTISVRLTINLDGVLMVTAQHGDTIVNSTFTSVLNASTKSLSPMDEKTIQYMASVLDYAEYVNLDETNPDVFKELQEWTLGTDVPKYAIENRDAIVKYLQSLLAESIDGSYPVESDEDYDSETNMFI